MTISKNSDRIKFASTLRKDLYEKLQNESSNTGIPISKLLDKAVEILLSKDILRINPLLQTELRLVCMLTNKDIYNVVNEIVSKHIQNEQCRLQKLKEEMGDNYFTLFDKEKLSKQIIDYAAILQIEKSPKAAESQSSYNTNKEKPPE